MIRCPTCYPHSQLIFSEQKVSDSQKNQLDRLNSVSEQSKIKTGMNPEEKRRIKRMKAMADFDKVLPSETCSRSNFIQLEY